VSVCGGELGYTRARVSCLQGTGRRPSLCLISLEHAAKMMHSIAISFVTREWKLHFPSLRVLGVGHCHWQVNPESDHNIARLGASRGKRESARLHRPQTYLASRLCGQRRILSFEPDDITYHTIRRSEQKSACAAGASLAGLCTPAIFGTRTNEWV